MEWRLRRGRWRWRRAGWLGQSAPVQASGACGGRGLQDVFCTTSRTILPKGACCPLLDTPCRWRAAASSLARQSNVWPLHRQSGRSCPDTQTNLVAVGCDRASFRAPRNPIDQGACLPLGTPAASSAARGAFLLPIDPMTEGLSAPLRLPPTTLCADWMRGARTGARACACGVRRQPRPMAAGLSRQGCA